MIVNDCFVLFFLLMKHKSWSNEISDNKVMSLLARMTGSSQVFVGMQLGADAIMRMHTHTHTNTSVCPKLEQFTVIYVADG